MILVTGASGNLAKRITELAQANGHEILTASRSGEADRMMDFDRPESLDFSGVETLLLTSAGYAEDDVVIARHGAVIAAARAQGVRQVIYTSFSAASDHLGFALAHRWTERALRDSGLDWTILRNGLYAELVGALAAPRAGTISAPFGSGPIAAVARDDLAQAAVAVLADPARHAGRIYELSGNTAFSLPELARAIGVDYAPVSFEAQRAALAAAPLLPFQSPMLMSLYGAASAGFLASETTDLLHLVPAPRDALALAAAVAASLAA